MALESADQIWELVPTNPESGDPVAEGDNHLRMIKLSLQNSLPGMSAPWTTSSPINCGDPVVDQDAVTLKYLNTMPHNTGIGFPIVWLLPALPSSDHLDLEGQLLNRIDYAELFALYGITYGAGDGTTTFQLPDMRGLFSRAVGTNVNGAASGAFGTKQNQSTQDHTHYALSSGNAFFAWLTVGGAYNAPAGGSLNLESIQFTGSSDTAGVSGQNETRPANMALLCCIKT